MTDYQPSLKTPREEYQFQLRLAGALARKSFYHFVKVCWPAVEPLVPYQDNWHIGAICEHLQAVKNNQIKNLIISVPPGHMKSLATTVFFPGWIWTLDPSKRFIFASYAQTLSVRDSIRCRQLITSYLYKQLFTPSWKLSDDQNQKTRFNNTSSGYRIATSVGGTGTGERADYIVVDDPLNAMDAPSELARQEAIDWWDTSMSSRDEDPATSHRIIIMQRLHENDLAGHCIASGKYELLKLPAEYDASVKTQSVIGWKDPRTTEGELLWPARFTREHQESQKTTLGSLGYAAQQQQDPKPREGGLFKRRWWTRFDKPASTVLETVQFWDCAQKPGITNDYSVCATWFRTPNGYQVIDVWRDKVDTPTLEAMTKSLFDKFKPQAIVIEDKSAGSALIQYLLRFTTLPVLPFDPGQRDKEVRATAATPTIEAGKVSLPLGASWVEDFISEHEKFPVGKNDDQVDTTSMAVEYFSRRSTNGPRVRTL